MNKKVGILILIILLAVVVTYVVIKIKYPNYTCPKEGEYVTSPDGKEKVIDCMPMIGGRTKKFCKPNYRDWIQDNCPDISIYS